MGCLSVQLLCLIVRVRETGGVDHTLLRDSDLSPLPSRISEVQRLVLKVGHGVRKGDVVRIPIPSIGYFP